MEVFLGKGVRVVFKFGVFFVNDFLFDGISVDWVFCFVDKFDDCLFFKVVEVMGFINYFGDWL